MLKLSWLPKISTVLIILGAVEVLAGGGAVGFLAYGYLRSDRSETAPLALLIFAVPLLCFGALRVVTGLMNRRFRAHTLGLVVLILGLFDLFAATLCGMGQIFTTLALVSYLSPEAKQAFAWGAAGKPPAEIRAYLLERDEQDRRASPSATAIVLAVPVGLALLMIGTILVGILKPYNW